MNRRQRHWEKVQAARADRSPQGATHLLMYSQGWGLYPVSWLTEEPGDGVTVVTISSPCDASASHLAKVAGRRLGSPVALAEDDTLRARLERLRHGDHHPAYWVIPGGAS